MRNCITKFSVFYPTLKVNLEHADYRYTEQVYLQEGSKKIPEVRKGLLDPREKERTGLFQELLKRRDVSQ